MSHDPYKQLAERLDALPQGYPPTDDGAELRVLAKLFSPEDAALAAQLRITLETPAQLAERIGGDPKQMRLMLKRRAKRGLITAGRANNGRGMGYGLMPFAIGIYEMQVNSIDKEFAQLFEDYYQKAFSTAVYMQPQAHRGVPIGESVPQDIEVRPFESAVDIVENVKAWAVIYCLCRKQKALIGDPCDHPLDVCMIFSETEGAFDNSSALTAQTKEESLATLQKAAEAGLVHSVSNNQQGLWYICNCCTCSCGVLRGQQELGIANVVARADFVMTVDEDLCIACGLCEERCQFEALTVDDMAEVNAVRCVGCGVCVLACPEGALILARRPPSETVAPPLTEEDWMEQRAKERGIDLSIVR